MKYNITPRLKRHTPLLVITSVVISLSGIAYYEIYLPNKAAAAYERTVMRSATDLKDSVRTLGASTEWPLLSDPYTPVDTRLKNAADTKAAIQAVMRDVDALRSSSDTLQTFLLAGFTRRYHDARVLREKSARIVTQTRIVLREYENTVAFLEAYTKVTGDFSRQIAAFNAIDDREAYYGRRSDIQAIADAVATEKNELWSLVPPDELQKIKEETFSTMDQAEKAFRRLAFGISVGVESIIYDAVGSIEKAELKNDTTDLDLYFEIINGSLVAQNVRDLPEKPLPLLQKSHEAQP